MFDRFTDRARQVMGLARKSSQRLHHDYIGQDHMFLALLSLDAGVAVDVLRHLDIDLSALRASFEARMPAPGKSAGTMGQLPFTPAAKRCLEASLEEASQLGHTYIGSEHLLLGLMRSEDQAPGRAMQEAGCSLEGVREAVLDVLSIQEDASSASGHGLSDQYPPKAMLLRRMEEIEALLVGLKSEIERLRRLLDYDESER